jgi:hypothetical protein
VCSNESICISIEDVFDCRILWTVEGRRHGVGLLYAELPGGHVHVRSIVGL